MMLLKKVVEDIRMDTAILCYSIPRLQKASTVDPISLIRNLANPDYQRTCACVLT